MIARPKLTPEELQAKHEREFMEKLKGELTYAFREIPAKYRDVRLSKLEPSTKSRLPLEDQRKLYEDVNAHRLEGWAFFAPAGYSKTPVSWGLYKYALFDNLLRAVNTGKQEFVGRGHMEPSRDSLLDALLCLARDSPGMVGEDSGQLGRRRYPSATTELRQHCQGRTRWVQSPRFLGRDRQDQRKQRVEHQQALHAAECRRQTQRPTGFGHHPVQETVRGPLR
jgi:hypothetical protein